MKCTISFMGVIGTIDTNAEHEIFSELVEIPGMYNVKEIDKLIIKTNKFVNKYNESVSYDNTGYGIASYAITSYCIDVENMGIVVDSKDYEDEINSVISDLDRPVDELTDSDIESLTDSEIEDIYNELYEKKDELEALGF